VLGVRGGSEGDEGARRARERSGGSGSGARVTPSLRLTGAEVRARKSCHSPFYADHTREPLLIWSGTRLRLGYKSVTWLTVENFGGSWLGWGGELPSQPRHFMVA
jgi:hypothetical protein